LLLDVDIVQLLVWEAESEGAV